MKPIEFENGIVQIDASIVAEGLGLAPSLLQEEMRAGRITSVAERGVEAARAVVRMGGAGHSAAIHSTDPRVIMRYGIRVPVLRVAVNVGNSTGSAGNSIFS